MQRSLDQKKKGRMGVGVIALVLSLAYTIEALDLPMGARDRPGAGVFPVLVGVTLAVTSILTIIEAWRSDEISGSMGLPSGRYLWRVVLIIMLLSAYALLLPYLGQLIGGTLFLAATMRVLSNLSWQRIVAYSLIASLLSYVLFVVLLEVRMPRGLLGL